MYTTFAGIGSVYILLLIPKYKKAKLII